MSLIDQNGKKIESELKGKHEPFLIPNAKFDVKADRKVFKPQFVQDYEEEEATRQIEEHLGFPLPKILGYHLLVKIYIRSDELSTFINSEGKESTIYAPKSATANDQYRNMTVLVLAKGKSCFKDESFGDEEWCRVGDWLVIPRNEGTQFVYRGVPMQCIRDNKMFMVVDDPSYVTRD